MRALPARFAPCEMHPSVNPTSIWEVKLLESKLRGKAEIPHSTNPAQHQEHPRQSLTEVVKLLESMEPSRAMEYV